eukprot:5832806-Amphidinium_carterae.1
MHHLDNEGMFISNRAGSVLCRDYNKGDCIQKPGSCPRNAERVHQCSRCLGHHPGHTCGKEPKMPAGKGRKGGSKGNSQ